MKMLVQRFGRLRLLGLLVVFVPFLVLPILGFVWLWQASYLPWWLLTAAIAAVCALVINWLVLTQEKRALDDVTTEPGGNWPAEQKALYIVTALLA